MTDTRFIAAKILTDCLISQSPFVIPDNISAHDKSFIRMLLCTTLRHLPYIQKVIRQFSTAKNSSKQSFPDYALILGTAELLYMSSPSYAVINSYVNIVKKASNKYTAGFANAVLHKIAQTKSDIISKDTGEFFSDNFRKMLQQHYSQQDINRIEKACLHEPCLDITLKTSSSSLVSMGNLLPLGTLRLTAKGKISDLPEYDAGNWWIQDFSSALPVKMLDNLAGKKVLDLCAAPGGKSAQLLNAQAQVTIVDISEKRLQILRQNLQRLNLKPEEIVCADALHYLNETTKKFDIILLDAPCSATGTLRRHPEIAHFKTTEDVKKQSLLQKQLLEASLSALTPEGYLLYCTCSLCPEEGELQISDFINRHPQARPVNLAEKLPDSIKFLADSNGFIRILPHMMSAYGYADGFFIALLQLVPQK